jgi:hypothetical protein
MRRICSIFIFIFCALGGAHGQDCAEFNKTNAPSPEFIDVISSKAFEKKNEESIENAKELLKKDLQLQIAKTILTEVKVETKHMVQETNGQFSEFFQSQTKTETSASVSFATFDFCEDKKARIVWGKCRVNKLELGAATLQNCISKMTALNAEIQGIIISESKIDVQSLKKKYLTIYKDFQTAIHLNSDLNLEKWNSLIKIYNQEMGRLSNSQDQIDFETDFQIAKEKLKSSSYAEAISLLNKLKLDHFNNEELNRTLENAIIEYKAFVLRRAGEQKNQRDFAGALSTIATYCGLITCDEQVMQLREDLSKRYLVDEAEKFRKAIKFDEPLNVEKHKSNIDFYKEADRKLYEEVCEEYNDFHIKMGMKQVLANKAKREYWKAYGVINELENRYGKRDSELKKLKSQIQTRILRQEVRLEKSKRAKTMSIWLGSDLFSNGVLLDSMKRFEPSDYMFTYSFALYWKYKFEKNYKRDYPVRSDFLGVKFRILDYGSRALIDGNAAPKEDLPDPNKYAFDLGVDGYTFRVLHYGVSMNLNEDWRFSSPNYYQLSLGFRLPLSIFSWVTDFNIRSQLKGEGYAFLSSGISLRFDCNRKFNRQDKLKIKAEKFS